jgi:hypothetical protein
MPSEQALVDAKSSLNPKELAAYDTYVASGKPALSLSMSLQLYELFLNGKSCEEIARLNPHFTLGMIVRARVEGLWDARKAAHVSELYGNVRDRVQQVQLEAVRFTTDMISAAHKQFSDKIQRYLMTGDERELGDLQIRNLRDYKSSLELLLKITGQDKEQKITGQVVHKHEGVPAPTAKAFTPEQADEILKIMEARKKEEARKHKEGE